MNIKLWIDDCRRPPAWDWAWATNSWQAIEYLYAACEVGGPTIEIISFDHDLGGADTSMRVANELERLVYDGIILMPDWEIHSANPPGRANLARALTSADRFAKQWRDRLASPQSICAHTNEVHGEVPYRER